MSWTFSDTNPINLISIPSFFDNVLHSLNIAASVHVAHIVWIGLFDDLRVEVEDGPSFVWWLHAIALRVDWVWGRRGRDDNFWLFLVWAPSRTADSHCHGYLSTFIHVLCGGIPVNGWFIILSSSFIDNDFLNVEQVCILGVLWYGLFKDFMVCRGWYTAIIEATLSLFLSFLSVFKLRSLHL